MLRLIRDLHPMQWIGIALLAVIFFFPRNWMEFSPFWEVVGEVGPLVAACLIVFYSPLFHIRYDIKQDRKKD